MAFFRLFAWRYFVFSRGVISSFRYFVFSRGVFSFFRVALFRGEKTKWHKPATINPVLGRRSSHPTSESPHCSAQVMEGLAFQQNNHVGYQFALDKKKIYFMFTALSLISEEKSGKKLKSPSSMSKMESNCWKNTARY